MQLEKKIHWESVIAHFINELLADPVADNLFCIVINGVL